MTSTRRSSRGRRGAPPTPTVKRKGLTSRPKARGGLGGACCSQWGGGVRRWTAASGGSVWAGLSSSSAFLLSGFLEAFLKPHLCWRLWGHLQDRWRTAALGRSSGRNHKHRHYRTEPEPRQDSDPEQTGNKNRVQVAAQLTHSAKIKVCVCRKKFLLFFLLFSHFCGKNRRLGVKNPKLLGTDHRKCSEVSSPKMIRKFKISKDKVI